MSQQRLVGGRKNFVTKEAWSEVRTAFAELPAERRVLYEQESQATQEHINHKFKQNTG